MIGRYKTIIVAALLAMATKGYTQQDALTLDSYVKRAVEEGIQAKISQMTLEEAGYTRQVIFRQTDSPAFTLNNTTTRGETTTNGLSSLTKANQTNLTGTETTPLGTTMNVSGQWATAGGTGVTDTTDGTLILSPVSKPSFTANVTQPIYIFVKNPILRTRQEATLNFANAKAFYETTAQSIWVEARSLYYTVVQNTELIKFDERKVMSSQRLMEATQALVQAGRSAGVDTMRSKLQLQTDQRQLENDQVLKEKALLQAKNFAFIPLESNVTFVSELGYAPFNIPLQRLLDYAVLHNPSLDSLRNSKQLALLTYQAAVEPTRPTFSLNGTYTTDQTGGTPDIMTHGWTWTSTANWLFFDSFVTRDQARSAKVAEWVADLNLQNAERTTRVNVESAYLDVKRTEKQITDFQFARDQAARNVDVLRLRFQNGLTTLLDVLDAENQERALDTEYLGLQVQFNLAKDQLSQQIGVDVETLQ